MRQALAARALRKRGDLDCGAQVPLDGKPALLAIGTVLVIPDVFIDDGCELVHQADCGWAEFLRAADSYSWRRRSYSAASISRTCGPWWSTCCKKYSMASSFEYLGSNDRL